MIHPSPSNSSTITVPYRKYSENSFSDDETLYNQKQHTPSPETQKTSSPSYSPFTYMVIPPKLIPTHISDRKLSHSDTSSNLSPLVQYTPPSDTFSECWGCRESQPNQLAHMDYGGCLYIDD